MYGYGLVEMKGVEPLSFRRSLQLLSKQYYLYRNAIKMSTIKLKCSNCSTEFHKNITEYNHRIKKDPDNPNFFCSRACSSSFNATKKWKQHTLTKSPGPQLNNKYRQKYPSGTGWYIQRCSQDRRKDLRLNEDRESFANHIQTKWEEQGGMCNLTDIKLERRDPYGKCISSNPFVIASLDRIDNNVRYTIGNVHWVSYAINLARNDIELNDFVEYLTVITDKSHPNFSKHWYNDGIQNFFLNEDNPDVSNLIRGRLKLI